MQTVIVILLIGAKNLRIKVKAKATKKERIKMTETTKEKIKRLHTRTRMTILEMI